VKNTFLKKALSEVGLPDLSAVLKGQTAVVVGDKDAASAAKVLKTFAAETKKTEIRGGIVDRLSVTKSQVEAIADLPSREVLLATLLGVLQAPASKLVRTLNEPGASLARVLQAKVDAAA
jgi:large subunit ribosomal protein L10